MHISKITKWFGITEHW